MTELVTITAEPRGETYSQLLRFAHDRSSLFSLTWRDQLTHSPRAADISAALRGDLVAEARTESWPGTQLHGHLATMRLYRITLASLPILARAGRLYAWEAPERPEDLAFYATENTPWLGSIAHERDSFIYGGAVDIRALTRAVPGIRLAGATTPEIG